MCWHIGQVVAFIPVETSQQIVNIEETSDEQMPTTKKTNRLAIAKMTNQLAEQAVLKGVITMSPYIEAYCRKEKDCKSVCKNEFLYSIFAQRIKNI